MAKQSKQRTKGPTFQLARRAFKPVAEGGDPLWNERRVFSRWEAWVYLLERAAHTAHDYATRQEVVHIERGCTPPMAERYLMKAWGWKSRGRVRRFLDYVLADERLAEHAVTTDGVVYRIVNYDAWQLGGTSDSTPDGTSDGTSGGTKKKEGVRNGKEGEAISESEALFELAWTEYPKRGGHSKARARRAWDARVKEDSENAGLMLAGVKKYAAHCKALGTEQKFIKHAATFFGPDLHFLDPVPAADDPKVVPIRKSREEQEFEDFVDRMNAGAL